MSNLPAAIPDKEAIKQQAIRELAFLGFEDPAMERDDFENRLREANCDAFSKEVAQELIWRLGYLLMYSFGWYELPSLPAKAAEYINTKYPALVQAARFHSKDGLIHPHALQVKAELIYQQEVTVNRAAYSEVVFKDVIHVLRMALVKVAHAVVNDGDISAVNQLRSLADSFGDMLPGFYIPRKTETDLNLKTGRPLGEDERGQILQSMEEAAEFEQLVLGDGEDDLLPPP